MSTARPVFAGATYLITRRCSERRFLLRPSELTNAIFLFVLAVAAARYGIRVHAFFVMSNHWHIVLTDPRAELPRFAQYVGAFVARAVNASLNRWDAFWDCRTYSAVRLVSPEDIVDKTAYVLANPVAAGLVRTGRLWPGLWSGPDRIGGKALEVARPSFFFKKNGPLPKKVPLELVAPPGFASPEEFRERVSAALAEKEREAQEKRGARGFLGVAAVLAQDPLASPTTPEPRRGLSPRIACRDKWKRIEALGRLKEFVDAYRAALKARRAGDMKAVFPAGTYLMRVLHGVPCAASG